MNQIITKWSFYALFLSVFLFNTNSIEAQAFWEEDFANGVPAGWGNEDESGQGAIFRWCSNPTSGGGADCPSIFNGQVAFASSTATNGFVSVDSDEVGAATGGTNPVHISKLTTTPIDCSSQSNVFLSFESNIGVYELSAEDNAILQVSNDNGNTWSDYTCYPGLTPNVEWSANPEIVVLNISSDAAGQSSVLLRWHWTAEWEYHWSLDDIKLSSQDPTPPHDMMLSTSSGEFFAQAPNALTPVSQLETFGFLADISNIGAEDQTGVNLNVTISDDADGETVYTEDLNYGTVAGGDTLQNVPFASAGFLPPSQPAFYTGTYTLTSDSTMFDPTIGNNSGSFNFGVSDSLFSKDLGNAFANGPALSNWSDGEPRSWAYGNHYHVVNGQGKYASFVQFGLGDTNGLAGQSVTVWLYKWEDTDNDAQSQEVERIRVGFFQYNITGGESNQLITVPLISINDNSFNVSLEDNTDYLVVLDYTAPDPVSNLQFLFSVDIDYGAMTLRSQIDGKPRYGSFLGIAETEYSSGGFGSEVVPVARMAISDYPSTVAIEELSEEDNLVKVYPNPTNDVVNLEVELANVAKDLKIKVLDNSGKLLIEQKHQNITKNQFSFDVSDFANGIYHIHIVTESGIRTKRFVVQN